MVAVIDKKLVFGREQVLTSTQASKNFGEARRRARREPQFARLAQGDADSNRKGIPFSDTVGRERFEAMLEAEATDPISDEELFE